MFTSDKARTASYLNDFRDKPPNTLILKEGLKISKENLECLDIFF